MNVSEGLLKELAQRFEWHARNIYGAPSINSSPLYEQLSHGVAHDPDVLSLVTEADLSQQVSNLLLGAVHFLLLAGAPSPLSEFYPSLSTSPRSARDAYPYFHDFCLQNADSIRQLVTTQRVQTNEVRRCTALMPAFGIVAGHAGDRPLAIVEIGPSAGLHLLWDKYGYSYEDTGYVGNSASPVQLSCIPQGNFGPPLPEVLPTVAYRTGIDLAPVDVRDDKAILWLRALIWPEHVDRASLLEKAVQVARLAPPSIIPGDASILLPDVLSKVPLDMVLCLYHSYTLNQCPQPTREKITELVSEFAQTRDLFRISLEWFDGQQQPQLELFSYQHGHIENELLAYCESHGRMIEWLQP